MNPSKKQAYRIQNALVQFETLKKEFLTTTDKNKYDELFVQLFNWLRGKSNSLLPKAKMEILIEELEKNAALKLTFQKIIQHFIATKDFTSLFTDTGMLNSSSFFGELNRAFLQKFLPPLPDKKSFHYLLVKTFNKKSDYKYIKAIDDLQWQKLFKIIGASDNLFSTQIKTQILDSISLLSYRVMSLAFSKDLSQKWRASADKSNCFIEQNRLCTWLISMVMDGNYASEEIDRFIQELKEKIQECRQTIKFIQSNSVLYGTSLEQSYTIARAQQQLIRMRTLLELINIKSDDEFVTITTVNLFKDSVEHINKNSQINYVISRSIGLLAFQVSEHKRETGEHYITSTRKSYYKLFNSSMKGGLIICIAAFIKAELHYHKFPDFWAYFLYGLNYSLAFIVMYLLHATLATKQPAMTAAALAATIDTAKNDESEAKVSIMFARVWRSQFASFVGNLIVVFPICIGIAIIYNYFLEHKLLRPESYALDMLHAQHPGLSLCLLFAAFTGIFLFLSGIISGYVDNKVVYSNIPARIMEHPFLRKNFRQNKIIKLSNFVKNHIGAILGNLFLGMVLGFAPLIGKFFGVPFDIRHITISTAYYGFGIAGLDFDVTIPDWIWVTIGVLAIGFINFSVSFGLAFFTALRSRNISFRELPIYLNTIFRHFRKFPLDFFFPPKTPREPKYIAEKIGKKEK